jgi:hypothetical protein
VRCTNSTIDLTPEGHYGYKTSTKVAQDETTEQVFSRKDRKAYREAIKQRTEASAGHKKCQTRTLGQKSKARHKAARS